MAGYTSYESVQHNGSVFCYSADIGIGAQGFWLATAIKKFIII